MIGVLNTGDSFQKVFLGDSISTDWLQAATATRQPYNKNNIIQPPDHSVNHSVRLHNIQQVSPSFMPKLGKVIDKSFGFDIAVEEAQRAINAARVEAVSVKNGIGIVKLMGRYSGLLLDSRVAILS